MLRSAPSLCRFLRYAVEETLAGREAGLKEYSVGVEVFSRGEKFCPRTDPIVRVQARNLRLRLERYYTGPGANDPLVIELPKGTYVPVFRQHPAAARPKRARALIAAAAAVGLLLMALLGTHHETMSRQGQKVRQYLAP